MTRPKRANGDGSYLKIKGADGNITSYVFAITVDGKSIRKQARTKREAKGQIPRR